MTAALFTAAGLSSPVAIVYAGGNLYALNQGLQGVAGIVKYDVSGNPTPFTANFLNEPRDMVYDATNLCLYVLNGGRGSQPAYVSKHTLAGVDSIFSTFSQAAGPAGLFNPIALANNVAVLYAINQSGNQVTITSLT